MIGETKNLFMKQNTRTLAQIWKGVLILVATGILVYFTAGLFGWVLEKFYPDLASGLVGTEEARYLFGALIAPSFFLSFFFPFLDKKDAILKKILIALVVIVVLINAAIGLSSIIFSAVFISVGYALAKALLYLKSLVLRNLKKTG